MDGATGPYLLTYVYGTRLGRSMENSPQNIRRHTDIFFYSVYDAIEKFARIYRRTVRRLHVDDGFEVAVGVLQVDEVVVVGRAGGGVVGSFQRPEDLPEVLAVAERRVDGDRRAQDGRGDEDLDVRAPDALAVDPALVDVVRRRDRLVQPAAVASKLVGDQLSHLPPPPTFAVHTTHDIHTTSATYTSAFVMLTFRNAMEHWNADGRINSGSDQAILDINLVGF